jgi:hypothetical protein
MRWSCSTLAKATGKAVTVTMVTEGTMPVEAAMVITPTSPVSTTVTTAITTLQVLA